MCAQTLTWVTAFMIPSAAAFAQTGVEWLAIWRGDADTRTNASGESNWGTITFDLKSGGKDSLTLDQGLVPATIPIELYAFATTDGSYGPNNGVQALYTDIVGTALGDAMQVCLTLEDTFTAQYIPGISAGLSFDLLPSNGTGSVGIIAGLGAAQAAPPGPGYYDMPGAFTANAPHANGQPPVLIATGNVYLDQVSMNQGGTYSVNTAGNVNFWKMDMNAGEADVVNDSLLITVSPVFTDAADDLDSGETVVLNPGGGSGDPSQDALVEINNLAGPDDASVTVTERTSPAHEPSGGFATMGTTLEVETSLGDGEFFMTVTVPFDAADLAGRSPWATDLTYFDAAAETWVLAAALNTANSPGHDEPVGDRFSDMGDAPQPLSSDLGDYGVFWNPTAGQGFVWANVDHASSFSRATHETGTDAAHADLDADGDVDQDDFLTFALCYNASLRPPLSGCENTLTDMNEDGDVDGFDFLTFALCHNGTLKLPNCP